MSVGGERIAHEERLARLRGRMREEGATALVVFDLLNVRYLTGFRGSSAVAVVDLDDVQLVSDFRYRLQAAQEAPVARFVEIEGPLIEVLPSLLLEDGLVAIEGTHLPVTQWAKLEPAMAGRPTTVVEGWVERLREIKSQAEIEAIAAAATIVTGMLQRLTSMKVVGRSEREIALDLEIWARQHGSEPVPFPLIVASGPRGAMPHAETTGEPVPPGRLLVVDIGAAVHGYAADVTRTFATGPLGDEELQVYATVEAAQRAAREAARAGMTCAALDGLARAIIDGAGYGELFRHSLGHGVGLDVHEAPRLSANNDGSLEAGMVVTIEPGVYVEGLGGVRIEDTVLVQAEGIRVLSDFPRALVTLD